MLLLNREAQTLKIIRFKSSGCLGTQDCISSFTCSNLSTTNTRTVKLLTTGYLPDYIYDTDSQNVCRVFDEHESLRLQFNGFAGTNKVASSRILLLILFEQDFKGFSKPSCNLVL